MKRIMFFLSMAMITVSCSHGLKNVKNGYKLNDNKGIIVFSFTLSGQCGYAVFLDVRSASGDVDETIGMQDMFEESDWEKESGLCSTEPGEFSGKLRSIALDEGNYEMYRLSGISDHHGFSSKDEFTVKFKVTGNRITYLGNAHFSTRFSTFDFNVTDKRERDISLFEKKYPDIQAEYVINVLDEAVFSK